MRPHAARIREICGQQHFYGRNKHNMMEDGKIMSHTALWECMSYAIDNSILSKNKAGKTSFLAFFYDALKARSIPSKEEPLFVNIYIEEPQWEVITKKVATMVFLGRDEHDSLIRIGELLQKKYQNLRNCLSTAFVDASPENNLNKSVNEYLTTYLKLSNLVTTHGSLYREIIDRDSLRLSFMSGYEETGDGRSFMYRFFSPFVIENCVAIGKTIEEYRIELQNVQDEAEKAIQKEMIVSLLKEKTERCFFVNTIIKNSVFISSIYKDESNHCRSERLEHRSCVESIEMTRLIEKIDAYIKDLELTDASKDKKIIKILLISYVDLYGKNGLEGLYEFLQDEYQNRYEFHFNIYFNSLDVRCKRYEQYVDGNWIDIKDVLLRTSSLKQLYNQKVQITLYKDITNNFGSDDTSMYMNQASLNYLLGENGGKPKFGLVFSLDSAAMYRKNVEIKKDHPIEVYNEWLEKIISCGYNSEAPENVKDISVYPIPSLPIRRVIARYNMLALGLVTHEGHFEYKLKEEIIELFIRRIRQAREKQELLHIHTMISSFHSVSNTNYAKWNLVREEHYRGKSFCLFTFKSPTNRSGRLAPCKHEVDRFRKKYIYFSLWNLYKHIDLTWLANLDSPIKKLIVETKGNSANELNPIQYAQNIYIRLGWDYNCNDKIATYVIRFAKKEQETGKITAINSEASKRFIKILFDKLLRSDDCDKLGLSQCFRNALLNALYSRIRCLEDAVGYQMMNIHYDDKYKTSIDIEDDVLINDEMQGEIKIIEDLPSALLPDRWAIIRALKTLSQPMTEIDYYYMLYELENVNKINVSDFLGNVVAVCKHSNYNGSSVCIQSEDIWKKF